MRTLPSLQFREHDLKKWRSIWNVFQKYLETSPPASLVSILEKRMLLRPQELEIRLEPKMIDVPEITDARQPWTIQIPVERREGQRLSTRLPMLGKGFWKCLGINKGHIVPNRLGTESPNIQTNASATTWVIDEEVWIITGYSEFRWILMDPEWSPTWMIAVWESFIWKWSCIRGTIPVAWLWCKQRYQLPKKINK